jgi:hypothetical protein
MLHRDKSILKFIVMPNLFRHPSGQANCLVYTLQSGLHSGYFAGGMPKQVRHDVMFFKRDLPDALHSENS